ncbi:MAG: hypothetical protein Q7J44_07665 [Pseudotabrizicola sp.]|uniref:hypothetical protein n=1 Tax=Pseudotabrizicola sp. TaxID=2939647 RepID=UPI00271C140C|nr:hypothetical protein [Pseudotabrizicola sp.]MDO9638406.1 hypothetical protein [Pseudotabrizicola sp.]
MADHTEDTTKAEMPMGDTNVLSMEAVEGRLLAQRKVLAQILAHMLQQEGGRDLEEVLDSLSVMQDQQEDPGAVPDSADLIQGTIASEIRETVLAAARARSMMAKC